MEEKNVNALLNLSFSIFLVYK